MENPDTEDRVPFVLPAEDGPLKPWPCAHWTLDEWAEQYSQVRFKFRVHPRKPQREGAVVYWENEAISVVEATVAHLLAHVQKKSTVPGTEAPTSETDANPFAAYPAEEYCFYSAYNYMHQLVEEASKPALLDTVRWQDTANGRLDLKDSEAARRSTLWLGTSGAYTPCHLDTYGCNFVAQLQGRKRWILFPPADTAHLYPVRIPFEESSIFSQVNFKCSGAGDLLRWQQQFPRLRHATPHVVELKAGEVLFVPRHWWHFVENVDDDDDGNDQQTTVSISINMWVTGEDDQQSSISEALVQFLVRPLFEAYGDASWLNLGADLLTAPEAGRILLALLNKVKDEEESESDEKQPPKKRSKTALLNRRFVSPCKLENISAGVQAVEEQSSSTGDRHQIDLKDIVNCILDPEVIDLIRSKLTSLGQ